MSEEGARPAHHAPEGGFRNPWPSGAQHGITSAFRWMLERLAQPRRAESPASSLPRATPSFDAPRAARDALTITWVGHSTFLLQVGGWNVLTDPVWGERASPLRFAGPRRLTAPGVPLEALPPIDLVLQSHDHYDHLDEPTVRRLTSAHPAATWVAPLGLRDWLARRGARASEHDWGDRLDVADPAGVRAPLVLGCTPAQHFSGRGVHDRDRRLWCGWTVRAGDRAAWFVGDTGAFPDIADAAARFGPFDAVLMPIGAYDPRWFMRPVHMDPEEAVAAHLAAAARRPEAPVPALVGMHWGTFRLTDEPLDEPPRRARTAWRAHGLPDERLWILAHGETRRVPRPEGGDGPAGGGTTSGPPGA